MNLNNKNKQIIFFLSIVIVISCTLLGVILFKKVQMNLELSAKVEESIIETGWPEEVPIIKSDSINITKQDEGSWSITINKPVSYDDFRNYLLDLYDEGFKPISEMGAKSPKLLAMVEPQEEGFVLVWAGRSSEYTVEAFWKKGTTTNVSDEITEDDYVTILLYSSTDKEDNFEKNDIYEDDTENADTSGDITLDSGDSVNSSGDIVPTSGEEVLEVGNEE